jgi:hypothetical protein
MKRQERTSDKGIVIGFILAIAISVSCVFLYFSARLAPVATADPPMPFEKKLANMSELLAHANEIPESVKTVLIPDPRLAPVPAPPANSPSC